MESNHAIVLKERAQIECMLAAQKMMLKAWRPFFFLWSLDSLGIFHIFELPLAFIVLTVQARILLHTVTLLVSKVLHVVRGARGTG